MGSYNEFNKTDMESETEHDKQINEANDINSINGFNNIQSLRDEVFKGFDEYDFSDFIGSAWPVRAPKDGEKRIRLTLEEQLDIIKRFENGEKPAHIAKDLKIPDSSARLIIKRREKLNKFKHINQTFGSSKVA